MEVSRGVHTGAWRCTEWHAEMARCVQRYVEGCADVFGGMERAKGCAEVCGGAQRYTQVCMVVHRWVCGGMQRVHGNV